MKVLPYFVLSLILLLSATSCKRFQKEEATLGNLKFSVSSYASGIAYIDQPIAKHIEIHNQASGTSLSISIESIEPDIYFYLFGDSILIADAYLGFNVYHSKTFEWGRSSGNVDCLQQANCGGLSQDGIEALGEPTLLYDGEHLFLNSPSSFQDSML
ncbi:MAG: hypothetical protein ACFB10_23910 [Salibacteraceae bacterium]